MKTRTWLNKHEARNMHIMMPALTEERITKIFRRFQESWKEGSTLLEIDNFADLKLEIGYGQLVLKQDGTAVDEFHVDSTDNTVKSAERMFGFLVEFLKANGVAITGELGSDIFEGLVA